MLMLWLVAAALWAGARLFQAKASSESPWFWRNSLITMLILLGPAIEDSANGKDVYAASLHRVTLLLFVSLYAWAAIWVLERWRESRVRPSITSSQAARTPRGPAPPGAGHPP